MMESEMQYMVIETMISDGVPGLIPYGPFTEPQAEAKRHSILAIAAESPNEAHGALMFSLDYSVIKPEIYRVNRQEEG